MLKVIVNDQDQSILVVFYVLSRLSSVAGHFANCLPCKFQYHSQPYLLLLGLAVIYSCLRCCRSLHLVKPVGILYNSV